MGPLLEAAAKDPGAVRNVPGAVTMNGEGPAPKLIASLDELKPARDLTARRRALPGRQANTGVH